MKTPRRWARPLASSAVMVLLLAGCALRLGMLSAPDQTPAPVLRLPTLTATAVQPTKTPSPVVPVRQLPPASAAKPAPIPTPGIRAVDAELRFAAPVPAAADIRAWRPPPVAVPWTLHPLDHYWLRRPIPPGSVDFGLERYPYGADGGGIWRVHHGMDFANDPGTPVLAAADGTVVWVETGAYPRYQMAAASAGAGEHTVASPMGGSLLLSDTHELTGTATVQLGNPYGNVVILRHDWGWQGEPVYTLYGHLLEVFVQSGERVRAGDLLAGVGNTGDSTGPHLHFEVRVGQNHYNATRNPALWIAPYEGWGTLAGLVTDSNGMALDRVKLTAYPIDLKYAAGLDAESPHTTTTYVRGQVQPDDSWGENFVLPDLPAGTYRLVATTNHERLVTEVTIKAGVTSFVRLQQQHSVTPVPPATESASAG